MYLQICAKCPYNESFGCRTVKITPKIVDRDRALILDVVRRFGAISRTDIHHLTHLRMATISQLSRELVDDGRLREGGQGDDSAHVGRKLLSVNEEFGYVVGVDYDAEWTMAAVMDLHPRIKKPLVKEATYLNSGVEGLLQQLFGAGQQAPNMIHIEYGKGIGAGVIIEGKLFRGHCSGAGEFGHTHIFENGPPCKCGSFGCLEALAGIGALESRMRRAISDGGHSLCLAMAGEDPEKITGWMVLQAARQGDKMAVTLMDEI